MPRSEARSPRDPGPSLPGLEHRSVRLVHGEIHYVEAGTGAPLPLMHGGHGSWARWVANIARVAGRHRAIAR
ncbi:MAG: hypothetical protein EHM59_10790 [Betaproteobacteria bacterium]|nr:MAG: hypothetical protein EHM59_10790 [Betaproteobacteria bacterium]